MKIQCFGKVNLYLNISHKRVDNFHEIQSLFQSISLFDTITLTLAPAFELTLSKQSAHFSYVNLLKKNNLLEKVFDYFSVHFKVKPLKVDLNKQIPLGAGLGGGSSDAAGFMHALNKINDLSLSLENLEEIAKNFGSDVPFFIRGGVAKVTGRGETINSLPPLPKFYLILIYPETHISTQEAYQNNVIKNDKIDFDQIVEQYLEAKTVDKIAPISYNAFEEKTLKKYKQVFSAYNDLKKYSDHVSLSGSGSSVFAFFPQDEDLTNVVQKLKLKYNHVYWLRTNDRGSEIKT